MILYVLVSICISGSCKAALTTPDPIPLEVYVSKDACTGAARRLGTYRASDGQTMDPRQPGDPSFIVREHDINSRMMRAECKQLKLR